MSRWFVLGPLLVVLILGGCAGDDDNDVPGTMSTGFDVVFEPGPAKTCREGPVRAPGTPVTIAVRTALVTTSCRCALTTTSGWGCSSTAQCQSASELPGPNPTLCNRVHEEPSPIVELRATTKAAGCSVDTTANPRDPSASTLTVHCSETGLALVHVTVRTTDGEADTLLSVRFTPGGACAGEELPAATGDTGADDAGLTETGGDAGEADAKDADAS